MTETLDYLGVRPCCGVAGGWIAGTETRKRIAAVVSEWILRGWSVERATTEESRTRLGRCHCAPRVKGRVA